MNSAIPTGSVDAIRSLPAEREVEHCGTRFHFGSVEVYAECPVCGARMKTRAMSATVEVEDVVDAVLEWMLNPDVCKAAADRQAVIERDLDE